MKTRGNSAQEAAAALNRLVLSGAVATYGLDFVHGSLVVTATIAAQDELSAARAKRLVKRALDPVFPNATIIVRTALAVAGQGMK